MRRVPYLPSALLSILFSLLVSFPLGNWSDSEAAHSSTAGGTVQEEDTLLQFTTSNGHVVGFQKGSIVVAALDHMLRVDLVGARAVAPVSKDGSAPGNESKPVPASKLQRVTYPEAWEGITVVYEASDEAILKSTYHIRANVPGQPVQRIRLRYNRPVRLDRHGNLVIAYEAGEMTETAPVAWQEIDGQRRPVQAAYLLLGEREVGFSLGEHDPSFPLVIDPSLTWNTFLGGSGSDYGWSVAADGSGNVYVAGYSNASWGSPVRAFTVSGTNPDVFVAKLNSSGALTWNTFLGGSGTDYGQSVAVDGSGNVYVAGYSSATWGSPVRAYTSGTDTFAAKLNSSGALTWNTFLGGSGTDYGQSVAVDGSGNVYVAGYSSATWGSPVRAYTSGTDTFAVKLNSSGSLTWNTFLGGTGSDTGQGVAVDGSGNVYVTGDSNATWGSPVRAYTSGTDTFAVKLSSSGSLTWNTFLGGSGSDSGYSIAVDGSGNVYVAGSSNATWGSPVRAYTSSIDACAVKLDSSGSLIWNTFLGGTGSDTGRGVAVDGSGNVYVTGDSSATWGSPWRAYTSGTDTFATNLNSSGSLTWTGFLGGTGTDYGQSVAVDGSGNVYVAGYSTATWGSPVRVYSSGTDAFVAKIATIPPGITVTPTSGLTTKESGGTASFTAVLNSAPTASVTFTVASSDSGEATVSASSVTFTTANWNSPRTISVSGVDDDLVDGGQPLTIVLGTTSSSDTNYNGIDVPDVSVTNQDDPFERPPLGGETRVNATTAGTQTLAANGRSVALDAGGNFVVVWESTGQDGDQGGIYGQRFDSSGAAIGDEFRVNTTTTGNQTYASVAMDAAGNFLVVWSGNGPGDTDGVFAQRYSANGNKLGGEFRVNAVAAGVQSTPVAGARPTGGYVVAWSESDVLHMVQVDATGALVNPTTLPAAGTIDGSIDADVAADGSYVVVWEAQGTVEVACFEADGSLRYQSSVAAGMIFYDFDPSVAISANGEFGVAWAPYDYLVDSITYVYFQRFQLSDGAPVDASVAIASNVGGSPSLAMDDNGNAFVSYLSGGSIIKATLDANNAFVGAKRIVNTTVTGTRVLPSIVSDANGNQIAAWSGEGTGDTTGVFVQRYGTFPAPTVLYVDTTSDVADGTTTSIGALIANKGDDGKISLREAITAANNTANGAVPDRIYFSIAGAGPHTINVTSALPTILESVVIDGTSEPDYVAGTPAVRIDGAAAGFSGISIGATGGGSTIQGLMITGFTVDGINVASGANNVTIADNWIGTSGTGTSGHGNANVGNSDDGIDIAGSNALILRNVITNNDDEGIDIVGSGVTGHLIQGNYIGVDPDGSSGGGNNDVGIAIISGSGNTIGGTSAGAGNVISSNKEGIEINTANNIVQGNYIGTDVTRRLNRGNRADDGIEIRADATGNMIGGTAVGAGNLIAYNALHGVNVETGTGNAVLGNSIYANTGLGIDRGSNGVSVNNGTKDCSLANCGMDYPVFTSATVAGSTLTVAGYVGSLPGQSAFANARVEIFRSDNDGSGYGEGQLYLGFLTADANGNISGSLSVVGVAPGYKITGTATDGSNNTSEFGPNVTITTGGGLCPGFTVTTTTDGGAGSLRECITAANATTGATIVVPAGTYTLSIAGQNEDNNATGDLDIRSGMTIAGEGAKVTTINGGGIDRVFHVVSGTVTLAAMRIQNGNPGSGDGGGIFNLATLTLTDVAVANNTTSGKGGGISNDTSGTLTLLRSTISGNSTPTNDGGGIFYNGTAAGSLTNVTISGNSSSNGGGIYNQKTLTLANVTISNNSASLQGGGIRRSAGTITLKNTIVANSTSGGNCSGTITSAGYNIDSANTCAFAGTGDKINTNPNLGALADNGGPTQTHALPAGSPAIDAGTATGAPATDQRGAVRPQGTGYDIGAYEYATPTAVKLISFSATGHEGDVHLQWQTGYEVDNLGFHVYREEEGHLYRLTPELIGGSALLAGAGTPLGAGLSYQWWDLLPRETGKVAYWLEDIDLSGTRTLHGPVSIVTSGTPLPEKVRPGFLRDFGMKMDDRYREEERLRELRQRIEGLPRKDRDLLSSGGMITKDFLSSRQTIAKTPAPAEKTARTAAEGTTAEDRTMQRTLASGRTVKIVIDHEGWYRIDQSELAAAGFRTGTNLRGLQLFADGREQSFRLVAARDSRSSSFDAIEFYGTGTDTPWTDKKVYWLTTGTGTAKRIKKLTSPVAPAVTGSFPFTVRKKDRTIYFAALRNGEKENFFGPVISPSGVNQILHVPSPSPSAQGDALLEVVLQGVTTTPHRVTVLLNDEEAGEVDFDGQTNVTAQIPIPQEALLEGDNLLSLRAANGETDVSLLDQVRLTYQRTYRADEDTLTCTADAGVPVTIDGFRSADIRVIDITAPEQMYEITGAVRSDETGYAVTFTTPGSGARTLFAFTENAVGKPVMIKANSPSSWSSPNSGADLVIISHRDFREALQPLMRLRQSQRLSVVFVDVEDLYDEFSFGAKDPRVIREFLRLAKAQWRTPPRVVLLAGDAGVDPRNYLGFGDNDLVPTKLIDTQYLETASDDWFTDFNDDGLPEMAVGRLPVRTKEEAAAVVAKIQWHERPVGMNGAVFVADTREGFDFEAAAREIEGLLPVSMPVHEVFRGRFQSDGEARQEVLSSIDQGPSLVTYIGHGSVGLWRGGILSSDDADGLINGARLPFVVAMTCLNGAFHDLYTRSLAEALLTAPQGGAVAVWASSGLTEPEGQLLMNKELMRLLFNGKSLTLGEATMRAKAATTDQDIRKTWILFGDPMTRLKGK